MKIMATVAMPAEVAEPAFGSGEGVVLFTTVTMMKHIDMSSAEIHSVGLRPQRSEKKVMKMATMMNFSAPNKPVISRFWFPPPTRSLKNCGAKYARAVMPVDC